MNYDNDSNIYGLRVYFSATSVTSFQVTEIIKGVVLRKLF